MTRLKLKSRGCAIIFAALLLGFAPKEGFVSSRSSSVSLQEVIDGSSLILVAEHVKISSSTPLTPLVTSFRVKKVLWGEKMPPLANPVIDVEDSNKELWEKIGEVRMENQQKSEAKDYVYVPVPTPIIPTYESTLSEEDYAKAESVILFLKHRYGRESWQFTVQNSYEAMAKESTILKILNGKIMAHSNGIQPLESYVLKPDEFHGYSVPKRLTHDTVAGFVMASVGRDTPLASLVRVEKLVTFYDLQEVCGHLLSLFAPNPAQLDVARGAVIGRTIAATCSPAQAQMASEYFPVLIAKAQSSSEIGELLEWLDRLGPGTDSSGLEKRIEHLRSAQAARADPDYQARREISLLDEMRSLRLDRVRHANAAKARVLAIRDREKRIGEEIKMYLTLDYGYLEYLSPWSAIRLRRETWGDSPADQVKRGEDTGRRAEMAKRFRTLETTLSRLPDVDPENVPSLRVRCLRAAAYFNGAQTTEERKWISQNSGGQVDDLSDD